MRISLALSLVPLVGSVTPPTDTIVSIKSGGKDVDVSQLPTMLAKAGYTPDPEVASFLETAEITTLEYVHSQVVQTPPHTIGTEALCSFVTSASSKLSLQSECSKDVNAAVTSQLDPDLHVNDPYARDQRHLKLMKMGEVWRLASPHVTRNVKVAVLDSGIDWTDRDFAPLKGRLRKKSGGYLEGGWNFFTNSSVLTNGYDHGTPVCKILAAKGNNSVGIAGVAPNVTLVPLQMVGDNGAAPLSKFFAALNMAMDLEVDVISMSLAYGLRYMNYSEKAMLWQALAAAQQKGIVLVSGAGNWAEEASNIYPCWYGGPNSLCVAYMWDDNGRNTFHANSNWGDRVDVAAYGYDILTGVDKDGNERTFGGSSASTPIVAGLAAILLSMDVEPSMVKRCIVHNTDPVYAVEGKPQRIRGGAVNALKTVQYAIRWLSSKPRGLRGSDKFN
ncbi:hypothetical protein FOZ63_026132 [Perkinsus olseni]|nr:hypothetical protein FOZ63_026132 [Perkinsus olseni]